MSLLTVILLMMGVFSLLYFVSILMYTGPKSAFLWFWMISGIALIVIASVNSYVENNKILVPSYVKMIVAAFVFLCVVIFSLVEFRIFSAGNKKVSISAGYVIILGAQVKGKTLSKALKSRLDTAYEYLIKNRKAQVIVSGGQGSGEDISEADAMSNYLKERGIETSRIIKEDQSTNTYENIKYSRKFLKEEPLVILVSSNFHIYRAMGIAKKQGLKVHGLGAPVDDILALNYYVREFFAVVKDKLIGNI